MKPSGKGQVLPAGSLAATDTLPDGEYSVTIDGIDDSGLLRCIYPGDFVKHHQAETVEELTGKIVNQLRGRYGADEVVFTAVPKKLAAGEQFKVKG